MPNTRETLIELVEESTGVTYGGEYGDEEIQGEIDISDEDIERIADHLIVNGVTIQKWIPVEERLPEEGERVLFTDGAWVGEGYINKRGKWQRYLNQSYMDVIALDVTHWMPMPALPEV